MPKLTEVEEGPAWKNLWMLRLVGLDVNVGEEVGILGLDVNDSDGDQVFFIEFSSMEPEATGDCFEGPTSAWDGMLTLMRFPPGMSLRVIERDCVGGVVTYTWGDADN